MRPVITKNRNFTSRSKQKLMEKSELVSTLKAFSAPERKHLVLFLQSPYCVGGQDTTQELSLVNYIFGVFTEGQSGNGRLNRHVLYQVIFPDREYREQTLSNLASDTLKLIRRFMEAEMLKRMGRTEREYSSVIQFLSEKGAIDLCEKYIKRLARTQKPESEWDNQDYYLNWRVEQVKSLFMGMHNQLTGDYNLRESLVALKKYYLVEYLDILTTLFNQNRLTPVLSPEERQIYLGELENWRSLPFFEQSLIQLYLKALHFFHLDGRPAEEVFQSFMHLLQENKAHISLYHRKRMEAFAYNFCARRFNQEQYKNVLLQLFEHWIEPERLNSNSTIYAHEILSLVTVGLAARQFDWVEKFLKTYRDRIQGGQPSEDYYQFNLALLFFYRGEFDRARDIVVRINLPELQYKYLSKTLEIKLFFEAGTDEYELVESKLNSLNVALSRESRMPAERKKRYTLFVNFMMRLNRWRGQADPDPKWLDKIAGDLQSAQNAAEWRWLTEKVEQLRSR